MAHANYNANEIIVPGHGTVLVSTKSFAEPFDPKNFDYATNKGIGNGWEPLQFTSKENPPTIEKEGGEITTLDAWETSSVYSSISELKVSITATVMAANEKTLKAAFGDALDFDSSKGLAKTSGIQATEKSVMVIFAHDGKRAAWYFPRVNLTLGDFPSINVEGAYEVQLKGAVLEPTGSAADDYRLMNFYTPRAYEGAAAAPGAGRA